MRIVGGLVPRLIFNHDEEPYRSDPHLGTTDVDIGLALSVLNEERYKTMEEALRSGGFRPGEKPSGVKTRQRWRIEKAPGIKVTIDFLIPPFENAPPPGKPQSLTGDLAATVTPALVFAFEDYIAVQLRGRTLSNNASAERRILVAGPAALLLMKAFTFGDGGRVENKDSYDVAYILRRCSLEDLVKRIRSFNDQALVREGLRRLEADFGEVDALGPVGYAEFMAEPEDEELRADLSATVLRLIKAARSA